MLDGNFVRCSILCFGLTLSAQQVLAESVEVGEVAASESLNSQLLEGVAQADSTQYLDEQVVVGGEIAGPKVDLKSSRTVFDLETINKLQPGSVFDILTQVPGVALTGGPRANGTRINIRGFSDNEDVLVVVDGAVKNFEKYRFGSVMPEPELLRELTVSRGPASAVQGSGAIGGVVEMETKDAADFLEDGERFGGFGKIGYASNNKELLTIGTIYGRPSDSLDSLFSFTKRDSDNQKLSNGDELPLSDAGPEALLAKTEWTNDDWLLGASFSKTETEGRELYDTSAFESGVNGEVYRETVDNTWATYLKFNPESELVNLQVNAAYTDTQVDEQSFNAAGQLLPRTWDYQYDIWSGRVHNDSEFFIGDDLMLTLQLGAQALQEKRTTKITDIQGSSSSESEQSQPSGKTLNWAMYSQAQADYLGWSLAAGYRWDHNVAEVLQKGNRDVLEANGLPTRIERDEGLLNYRIDYEFEDYRIKLFHSYVEAVRYPKLDEYFTQSQFSNCVANRSSAELAIAALKQKRADTNVDISAARSASANEIAGFTQGENATRDRNIAASEAQLALFIEQANQAHINDPQAYPEARRDADIQTARLQSQQFIDAARQTAQSNISQFTQRNQAALTNTVSALEAAYTQDLNQAGVADPSTDLDTLEFPSKTTLPSPYETLQLCGELYQPERANNREWGISYELDGLFAQDDIFKVKATHFVTRVNNVLESINKGPNNPASQPGNEKVWGYELEGQYIIDGWRFDLVYNWSRGQESGFRLIDNPSSTGVLDAQLSQFVERKKFDTPADELALSASWIAPSLDYEVGARVSHKRSRMALERLAGGLDFELRRQSSVTLWDLYASWQVTSKSVLQLNLENVTDASYKIPSGIDENGDLAVGNFNTGRDVRLSFTQYF